MAPNDFLGPESIDIDDLTDYTISVEPSEVIHLTIEEMPEIVFSGEDNITIVTGGYPSYDGPTVVIPSTNEQILETKQKSLESDITVKEIPYLETSNDSGGITVSIAS